MGVDYAAIKIQAGQAAVIAKDLYKISGEISVLPGELDFNFRVKGESASYILKISRPNEDLAYVSFQQDLLRYIAKSEVKVNAPIAFADINGNYISEIKDEAGIVRLVRLLSWLPGRLWSNVNPIRESLLFSLGEQAGKLTKALHGFDHPIGLRTLDWDVAQAGWTTSYTHLFSAEEQEILTYFQDEFDRFQDSYKQLRKGIVHSDVNDNNIVVSKDLVTPKVEAIIDYGDAIYTPIINDLAIAVAYAVFEKPDMLAAALPVVTGYHAQFPLVEEELKYLYNLAAMRLVITVTKSAINKQKEPENEYLLISEKPAWDVLKKWKQIDENMAHFSFRAACGYEPHPNRMDWNTWAGKQNICLSNMFVETDFNGAHGVDMSVSSTWLGNEAEYQDLNLMEYKLDKLRKENQPCLLAGGYLETRPFYSSRAYKIEGNNGPEYRTVHLGVDFWLPERTPVSSFLDGKVVSVHNNVGHKNYGPTIILAHEIAPGNQFYTLYGHLSLDSITALQVGATLKKGELIGFLGNDNENGNWAPHLHFQIMLDMLGNVDDFPGVCRPIEVGVFKSNCPDPNLLFNEDLAFHCHAHEPDLLSYRKEHLGKSLSLSYNEPLTMVRGDGAYLIDITGRKYLDTLNNVAHVGHEHPLVVEAGRLQMSVLNTNSRYLHENINAFAETLLSTFPESLSVVHFVNSGSEANELALRMAQAVTQQKDMIAVEIGYHGNTNACIGVSSYKFDGKGGSGAPENTHIVPLPDTYRGLYKGSGTGTKYAQHVQQQIKAIQSKERNVAAFICESIISCGGQLELPEDYLKMAYQFVRDAGGICIADEVQVGCGRVGEKFWGFELHNVIPDIVTIGKPIGNGHPLAAVVCTEEVANAFANGMEYFNTFGGNPVSCAIGKAVLDVIKSERLQENAFKVGHYLKSELQALQTAFQIIGDVRGKGLFLGVEFVDKHVNPLPDHAAYLANRMKDFGILMSTDGKDVNAIKIKPPMVFSIENATELLVRMRQVLQEDFMLRY